MQKTDLDSLSNKEFILTQLEKVKLLDKSDFILTLMSEVKCNTLFSLAFPLLKLYKSNDEEQFYDDAGGIRYYKQDTFFVFHDRKYIICNHWFPEQRHLFEKWIKRNSFIY